MFEKLLTWAANALLASVLVLVASQQAVFAQETSEFESEEVQATGTISVPLSGMGKAVRVGNLSATPDSGSFDLVEIGESVSASVTLSHIGGEQSPAIELGAVSMFGQSASEFFTSFGGYVTLFPGESIEVVLEYTPVVPGSKSAGLSIDVAGATAPFVVLLEAESRYPLVAEIDASVDAYDFGQTVPGVSATRTFTLTNTGETGAPVLNVLAVELSGEHAGSYSTDFQPVSLESGDLHEVTVTFQDSSLGVKSAELTILHDGNNFEVEIPLTGKVVTLTNVPVSFTQSTINANIDDGTAIALGPDNKLYVAQMDGTIFVFNAQRNGKDNYAVQKEETIYLVKNVQNHDDDGDVNNSLGERLVTGLYLAGTATQPVIWVASSDPRQGAGPSGEDKNLDTNSGILHKLTKSGGAWSKQDVVRGLPRSEENHASNGITFKDGKLLLMSGGFTNSGRPSNNFADISEYALSAALLEIDVASIGSSTYDLPTLDDEERAGNPDNNDPFGGNDGKNQAKLVAGGPVQIYSSGYRNAYDIVLTQSGKLYTVDNGPNSGWGGEATGADCSNAYLDGGNTYFDNLHLVTNGYYAGHPNPVRGNKGNTFNASNPQSPIEGAANPEECIYKAPGADGSLTSFGGSTNGIDEFTATNFSGTMFGDLVAANLSTKQIFRVELNAAGTAVTSKEALATLNGAQAPLDLVVHGDADPFPGTIWVVDNAADELFVLEPSDY